MKNLKVKFPQKGGAKKAAEIFEKTRRKEPSDRLVQIITEIPEIESYKKQREDRAAKDAEI